MESIIRQLITHRWHLSRHRKFERPVWLWILFHTTCLCLLPVARGPERCNAKQAYIFFYATEWARKVRFRKDPVCSRKASEFTELLVRIIPVGISWVPQEIELSEFSVYFFPPKKLWVTMEKLSMGRGGGGYGGWCVINGIRAFPLFFREGGLVPAEPSSFRLFIIKVFSVAMWLFRWRPTRSSKEMDKQVKGVGMLIMKIETCCRRVGLDLFGTFKNFTGHRPIRHRTWPKNYLLK